MKKKINLLFASILMMALVFSSNASASDTTNDTNYGVGELIPVADNSNDLISLYSTQKPSLSKIWNIASKGQYDFNGNADNNNLYTNYTFTGKKKYTVYVKNNNSKGSIKVTPRNSTDIFKSMTVNAGKTKKYTFEVNKKTDKVYLKFSAPCHFSGYIK